MNITVFFGAGTSRLGNLCKKFISIFAIAIIPLSGISQTISFPSSCTSKDLSLVSASLVGGDPCNSCTTGSTQTRNLVLGINNKTGSTRTSFAFWATLTVTHTDGSTTVSEIHRCAGPIPPTGPLPAFYSGANFGTITYQCGDALVLTNLYLAWTDASPNSTCASINPATINPKCGTLPMIRINAGVNAAFTVTDATCTGSGSMTASPYGGTAPFSVTVNGVTHSGITANGSTTFNDLAPGLYPVTITDANGCSITINKTIGAPAGIPVPQSTQTQTTCLLATGTCTITSPVAGYVYTLRQGGNVIYTALNGVFPAVAPGTYNLHAASGNCTNTGTDVTIDAQPGTPPAPVVCIVEPSLCGPATGSVTIISPSGAGYQYSINNGTTWQSGMTFNNVGAGSVTGIRAKGPSGCISDPAMCANSNCDASKFATAEPFVDDPLPAKVEGEEIAPQEVIAEENRNADFTVSPVPFGESINIRYNFDFATPVTIDILDSFGKLVLTANDFKVGPKMEVTVDLKSRVERNKVYFIRVTTNKGSTTKTLVSSH